MDSNVQDFLSVMSFQQGKPKMLTEDIEDALDAVPSSGIEMRDLQY